MSGFESRRYFLRQAFEHDVILDPEPDYAHRVAR
jgi:hypothetical protein